MDVHADLHAHSVFAGGTGAGTIDKKLRQMKRRFLETAIFSPLKGINLIGTGDVQFDPYTKFLEESFIEDSSGIFRYSVDKKDLEEIKQKKRINIDFTMEPEYVLQTEVIFTAEIREDSGRKKSHTLFLFPDFTRVEEFNRLLDDWGVSRKLMARPFIVCKDSSEVEDRVNAILDLDSHIELIPAHIMSPEGVYGAHNGANSLDEFYGSSASRIHAVETGLSADPTILGLVPELDDLTLISNADAHSSALNRLGREFTSFQLSNKTYKSLIDAIRDNAVIKTAEFHPTEGRYFLTGHRANRKKPGVHNKDQYCYYSPKHLPENMLCQICNKRLTIGVLQRAFEVCDKQGEDRMIGDGPKRPFVTMVPLIEILGFIQGVKTLTSQKLLKQYSEIIKVVKSEVSLWTTDDSFRLLSESKIDKEILQNLKEIKNGNFMFHPLGYDGVYGKLLIGETCDFLNIKEESGKDKGAPLKFFDP